VIGLDTNVLVRYIAQDDRRQAAKATHVIEEECSETRPGFVAAIVLAELVWVLESSYGSAKAEIVAVLQRILRTKQLVVQDAETIWKAVRLFEASKADFADCLIERTGATHECEYTSTFDKHAASSGMRLIE
jgi:predicted nucleic-acid-binding protein